MKKIYFIVMIGTCFLLSGCNSTNPTSTSKEVESTSPSVESPTHPDDNTTADVPLFSSLLPNNWTNIDFMYGGITDKSNPIQLTDQSQIKQFYQLFENAELVPTDELYEGYFCELNITTSEQPLTMLLISKDCISINEKNYNVNIDFTKEILDLLSDFGYTRDSYPQSTEFLTIIPNDWTAIDLRYGDITDSQPPIQITEKSYIDEFYQIFQHTRLTKVEEQYEGYWGELAITTSTSNLSIKILSPNRLSIDDTLYSVSSDFTQEIPLLLDSLQYL